MAATQSAHSGQKYTSDRLFAHGSAVKEAHILLVMKLDSMLVGMQSAVVAAHESEISNVARKAAKSFELWRNEWEEEWRIGERSLAMK